MFQASTRLAMTENFRGEPSSGKALSDFDRFGNAAAFGHQSRNIRAGTQIPAILQILDANPNGHFRDFRDVLLPLHGRFLRTAL